MKPPFEIIQETDIEKWRYSSFYEKEPETIEWLRDMRGNLFDVGANIGIYSLYYGRIGHYDSKVIAIEPFKKNFARLCENIKLNRLDNIHPLNMAVDKEWNIRFLNPVSEETGSSGHQLSDEKGEKCFVVSIDTIYDMAKTFFFPINYIKIDTDGNEYDIIQGAKETLASKDLQSVLIEVNNHKEEIIEIFKQNGFTTENIFNTMTPHSRERRAKEGIDAENIIFTRC
jgi:FkbM family methyltransferase